jgi:hypothetical protein
LRVVARVTPQRDDAPVEVALRADAVQSLASYSLLGFLDPLIALEGIAGHAERIAELMSEVR